jgi:SAM-dependent methyltransferase
MTYDRAFYEAIAEAARRSAHQVIPIILDYVSPKSVIDIGCGTGTWLSVFNSHGVADFLGVDAESVPKELLEIPTSRYVAFDLRRPFACARRFDLVLSLEVAEHLPSQSAPSFVESLARLGPVVLFSAAIPGQGGTSHLNEQWPEYWSQLFAAQGYVPVDILRRKVWCNPQVSWWYSQNMVFFCAREYLSQNPTLMEGFESCGHPLPLVHPRKLAELDWNYKTEKAARELRNLIGSDASFILVDNGKALHVFGSYPFAIPFPEHQGKFNGAPPDDRAALREFERLRIKAEYLVILHSAFDWLACYPEWYCAIRTSCKLLSLSECLMVYELPEAAGKKLR